MKLSFINQTSCLVLLLIFDSKNGEEEDIAYLTVPSHSAGLLYLCLAYNGEWGEEQGNVYKREVQRANVSLILQSQFLQPETSERGKDWISLELTTRTFCKCAKCKVHISSPSSVNFCKRHINVHSLFRFPLSLLLRKGLSSPRSPLLQILPVETAFQVRMCLRAVDLWDERVWNPNEQHRNYRS